jgi:hypothetical protein
MDRFHQSWRFPLDVSTSGRALPAEVDQAYGRCRRPRHGPGLALRVIRKKLSPNFPQVSPNFS